MNAQPVTVHQVRRDMRWSVSQSDEAAETAARRHREIARIIDRAEEARSPTPLFGKAPWIWS